MSVYNIDYASIVVDKIFRAVLMTLSDTEASVQAVMKYDRPPVLPSSGISTRVCVRH